MAHGTTLCLSIRLSRKGVFSRPVELKPYRSHTQTGAFSSSHPEGVTESQFFGSVAQRR